MLNPRLISALVSVDFPSRYYELCKAHNRFCGTCKCPHPEVMKALQGWGEVKKLGGPGRVYSVRVPEQPATMNFSFIIQSGITAELCLGFEDLEKPSGSSFAVLAYYANQAAGGADPAPKYPRPHFHSPSELREIISVVLQYRVMLHKNFTPNLTGGGNGAMGLMFHIQLVDRAVPNPRLAAEMRTVMKTGILIAFLSFAAASLKAQGSPAIDRFVPTLGQLGAGWVSNNIVALVDPLSSPSEVGDQGGYLEHVRKMVKSGEREAFAAVRYVYGGSNVWVWAWINRYKSKEAIPPDWGRDGQTKTELESLPLAGEEVRFSRRDGLHNDFIFRRGSFLVCVESVAAPIDKLRQLTEVLDQNLLKAQKEAASSSVESKPKK